MYHERILTIGGTGIVGTPFIELALKYGCEVYDISLGNPPSKVKHFKIDRRKNRDLFRKTVESLTSDLQFDTLIDICTQDDQDSSDLYFAAKKSSKKTPNTISFSTTLVYDRSKLSFDRISPTHSLAKIGTQGSYVDGKLKMEKFWRKEVPSELWTILRPYHILGKGSLLGCIPGHNRDPDLVEKIMAGDPIDLADGGRMPLNLVNPTDIAHVIKDIISHSINGKINVVNPTDIIARDYYKEIGRQLGKEVNINPVPADKYWKNPEGWSLTAFPHRYTSNFKYRIHVPDIDLRVCVWEALLGEFHNCKTKCRNKSEIPVHKNMNKGESPRRNEYYD